MTTTIEPTTLAPALADLDVTTSQSELLAALKFVNSNLSKRTPMQVLQGVLLRADADGLHVARFDYAIANRTLITGAGSGQALLHADTLTTIVNKIDKGTVVLRVGGGDVTVTQGTLTYRLPQMAMEDFPALPSTDGGNLVLRATGASFAGVQDVTIAASKDETMPVLTTVYLDRSTPTAEFAATDRYRLAVLVSDWTILTPSDKPLLIPAVPLRVVAKAFAKSEQVTVTASGGAFEPFVTISDGSRSVTLRGQDREFPKFRSLLPEVSAYVSHMVVDSAELSKAIDQVGVVAERNTPVRFDLAGPSVAAGGQGQATATRTLASAEVTGEALRRIAAQPHFLLDGIKMVGGKQVTMSFVSPTRPLILTGERPGLRYLVMPVRLSG